MKSSIKQCALAGCVTVMLGGCAAHQNIAPEYRLSSSSMAAQPGASMLQRGKAQLDAGLDALAIESFRTEIRLNPDSADAYNGLAVAYGRIGRNDLAQRYFETALAKDPANAKVQTNLARLTGDAAPVVQLAVQTEPAIMNEPVAVTSIADKDPIGQIIDRLEMPALAAAEMPAADKGDVRPYEILARQGVLSTRFAIAPARLATQMRLAAVPEKPRDRPQGPTPVLPPTDYRTTGTRLERVSLGEVRLITRPEPPFQPLKGKPDFQSFGDRLAIWLPQSVATEQAGIGRGMVESAVIMAAIDRAEEGQKLAKIAGVVMPELPEFAYLFFDDDTASV
jgi:hypothetical protein